MNNHHHKYKIDSDISEYHKHTINGYVEMMLGFGLLHFHSFSGICTYTDHTHSFKGTTGLPVKTEAGHLHKIEGYLMLQNDHEHKISGFTSEEFEFTDSEQVHGALI